MSSYNQQRGHTLLELGLALVIGVVVITVVTQQFQRAGIDARAANVKREVGVISDAVDRLYGASDTYQGLVASQLINLVPESMRYRDGTRLRHAFGGPVSLTPGNVGGANLSYSIVFGGIRRDQCYSLVPLILPDGFMLVVGGTAHARDADISDVIASCPNVGSLVLSRHGA